MKLAVVLAALLGRRAVNRSRATANATDDTTSRHTDAEPPRRASA